MSYLPPPSFSSAFCRNSGVPSRHRHTHACIHTHAHPAWDDFSLQLLSRNVAILERVCSTIHTYVCIRMNEREPIDLRFGNSCPPIIFLSILDSFACERGKRPYQRDRYGCAKLR